MAGCFWACHGSTPLTMTGCVLHGHALPFDFARGEAGEHGDPAEGKAVKSAGSPTARAEG